MTDMPSEHTEGLLRIGEVARLLNLSVGILRHYEQMGLLEPAYVDQASGYRYYGSRQLSTLNTIGNLRVLDLPLAQIREFVTTRDMDLMQRQLTKQQELIEHRRRELERMSRKIDQRLALLHGALNADLDTISEIEEPELRCATLHERVNPTDAIRWDGISASFSRGSTKPLPIWAIWVWVSRPNAWPPATLTATTRSSCCSMTPMITWATSRHGPPRAV